MTILELNHIAIHVADLDKSIRFYKEVLGLSLIKRPAFDFPGAWFRLGIYQDLHLIAGRKPDEPIVSASRKSHFALRVSSASEAVEHFNQLKIKINGPKLRPDGAIQLFVQDPDGYYVELTEIPDVQWEENQKLSIPADKMQSPGSGY